MDERKNIPATPRRSLRDLLQTFGPSAAAILLFAVIALAYFTPAVFEGRQLFQQDVAGASGTAQDVRNYEAATGERSLWTNSLFGGMPMYQISPSYASTKALTEVQYIGTLRSPIDLMAGDAWLLFAMLAGFFLFMRSMGVRLLSSVLGAVMWTFSSYFLILIAAGHIWKLTALCFIPPTIAGMVWIYRGKYLGGGITMAFFTALQILANHVQMSYYFLFVMAALAVAFLIEALTKKEIKRFLLSTGVMLLAGGLGVAVNSTNLYHTYQYAGETMRGGSELTLQQTQVSESTRHENKSGLTKDYITRWSYGRGETWTLLVPDLKGGASGYLGNDEKAVERICEKTSDPEAREFLASRNRYWGDQPFTSGPVYVGAFVCFLFVLGCFLKKGPIKWALLSVTLLSILLSWGRNFMGLTNFFIDYFPMYDKFRTVSSILVIAEFTIPTLAVLGLIEFLRRPKEILAGQRAALYTATGLTAGALLFFLAFPTLFFHFLSAQEAGAVVQAGIPQGLIHSLIDLRVSIFRADVWRSLIVVITGMVLLLLFAKGKLARIPVVALITVLVLLDLWTVDKRYLSDKDYQDPQNVARLAKPQTEADRVICADKTPGYRVMNLTVGDPFSDATTSAWHNSVGGYHPAKMQRYQDLIDYQLSKMNMQVYDMLNTRYFIVSGADGRPAARLNPGAFGPAWLVDSIAWVNSANEEMQALDSTRTDLRRVAVIDKRFATAESESLQLKADSSASIRLTAYSPDKCTYEVNTSTPALAVFSEIYYPRGWKAAIDGKPANILRADYVLRALPIPAGKHKITFIFDPDSVHITEWVAKGGFIILILLVLTGIVIGIRRRMTRKS